MGNDNISNQLNPTNITDFPSVALDAKPGPKIKATNIFGPIICGLNATITDDFIYDIRQTVKTAMKTGLKISDGDIFCINIGMLQNKMLGGPEMRAVQENIRITAHLSHVEIFCFGRDTLGNNIYAFTHGLRFKTHDDTEIFATLGNLCQTIGEKMPFVLIKNFFKPHLM